MSVFCSDTSVCGRRWEVRPDPGSPPTVTVDASGHPVLRDGTHVPRELVTIAARRGAADVSLFLEPTIRAAAPDPSSLASMDAAAELFCRAVRERRRVAVFGDYDVDGATSTALVLRWLTQAGIGDSLFHIPHRLTEGYGPNIPAIENLRREGAELLVIVDSGTGAFGPIARAREIGLDVIVLDHHEPNEDGRLPDAVVVNPKLPANDGSLSYLCAAGLVFLFLAAVNRLLRREGFFGQAGQPEPNLTDMLGMVALGTVADVVPLKGLNRAYVHTGLRYMDRIPGIVALQAAINDGREESKQVGWTAHACGFSYGPCINAGGRISDTMQGTRLLISDGGPEAAAMAGRLVGLNTDRREMQKEMVDACMEKAAEPGPDDSVIVIYDPAWHPGVVGLCASKVKDHHDRSAVVIGTDGKGSGRSVEGFNIGKAFLQAAALGILKKGGGHSAAAGLAIDPARVDEFRAFMQEQSRGLVRPPSRIDLAVPVGGIPTAAVQDFEMLAPFGMGNPRPRVAVTGGVLDDVRVLKGKHVKARLVDGRAQVDLILFNGVGTMLGDVLRRSQGFHVDVLGEIGINEYGGRTRIQIKPTDAMVGAAATEMAEAAA